MLRFGKTKVVKGKFFDGRKPINNQHIDVDNKFNLKLIETKNIFKTVIRPLVSFFIDDDKLLEKYELRLRT